MGKTYTDKLIEQSKKEKAKKKPLTSLKKLKKRLRKPLIKGGKRTSLGGGRVRVSTAAGIRGFFR